MPKIEPKEVSHSYYKFEPVMGNCKEIGEGLTKILESTGTEDVVKITMTPDSVRIEKVDVWVKDKKKFWKRLKE